MNTLKERTQMKITSNLSLLAKSFCVALALSSCRPSVIIYKYDKYDKYEYIDDGDIWGSQVFIFFEKTKNLDIKVDTIESREIDRALHKVLSQFNETQPSALEMFDDEYYEYVFITNDRDTLYTNGYFKSWKLRGRLITIEPDLSEFFQEKFDNPHPPG
ncbi:MAG: hypothetical protein SF052_04300 [Bacteroidia bacterium]|nr:hypothetical protein [Bacteroidia bacterium]